MGFFIAVLKLFIWRITLRQLDDRRASLMLLPYPSLHGFEQGRHFIGVKPSKVCQQRIFVYTGNFYLKRLLSVDVFLLHTLCIYDNALLPPKIISLRRGDQSVRQAHQIAYRHAKIVGEFTP